MPDPYSRTVVRESGGKTSKKLGSGMCSRAPVGLVAEAPVMGWVAKSEDFILD